jgi:hypothetical protein
MKIVIPDDYRHIIHRLEAFKLLDGRGVTPRPLALIDRVGGYSSAVRYGVQAAAPGPFSSSQRA